MTLLVKGALTFKPSRRTLRNGLATTFTGRYVHAHAGVSPLSGAALTHGFQIAFYVLAAIAAFGAVLALVLIESRPPVAQPETVPGELTSFTPALEEG